MNLLFCRNDIHDSILSVLTDLKKEIHSDIFISEKQEPLFVLEEEEIKIKRLDKALELIIFDTRLIDEADKTDMYVLIKNTVLSNAELKWLIITDLHFGDPFLHKLVTLGIYNILNLAETYGSSEILETKLLEHIQYEYTIKDVQRYFTEDYDPTNFKSSKKPQKPQKVQTKIETITKIEEKVIFKKTKKVAVMSPHRRSGVSFLSLSLGGFMGLNLDRAILVESPSNVNIFYNTYFDMGISKEYIKDFTSNGFLDKILIKKIGSLDILAKKSDSKFDISEDTIKELIYEIESMEYDSIIFDFQHADLNKKILQNFDLILFILEENLVFLDMELDTLHKFLDINPNLYPKTHLVLNKSIADAMGQDYKEIREAISIKFENITKKLVVSTIPLLTQKQILEILKIKDDGKTPYDTHPDVFDRYFSGLFNGLYGYSPKKKKIFSFLRN